MVTVELTKREADALSEATRLGDTDDLEALRTAIDKLWKAADAQQHGDTWRIIRARKRLRQTLSRCAGIGDGRHRP
jgi:hypothetical protein